MKKALWMFALALVVGLGAFACSEGSNSSPLAPVTNDSSSLTNVTGGVRSNDFPVLLCHHNPDFATEGGFEWHVIEKDDSQVEKHCVNHGDWEDSNDGSQYTCGDCDLSGYVVGDACCACAGGDDLDCGGITI
ncbi:MAG TPA: hypothetical protein VGC00_15545 [Thermoanaerobaculia bacterium]